MKIMWFKGEDVDIILILAELIRKQYDALVKGGKEKCKASASCKLCV